MIFTHKTAAKFTACPGIFLTLPTFHRILTRFVESYPPHPAAFATIDDPDSA
ncbi:MAG: hypothetical protein GY943_22630, partial [Chloroflexi bacterium]|nr:hypothetical protein [Chloroflexota bacterium]